MTSNFTFLTTEFPQLFEDIQKAEQCVCTEPQFAAMLCRRTLEKSVLWLYENEGSLTTPYETNLNALLRNYEFRQLVPHDLLMECDVVRKLGNLGVHSGKVNRRQAMQLLKNCFRFLSWLSRFYSEANPPISAFKEALIPTGEESRHSQTELQQLQQRLEAQRVAYEKQLRHHQQIEAENEELRKQMAEQAEILQQRREEREKEYQGASPVPPLTSEQETRKQLIDLLLFEAGWQQLKDGYNLEYEVSGMPVSTNPTGKGFVDYVLCGDNGKPLALVEAKSTLHHPSKGKHQAALYADCLEKQTGQRPIIFYSNGFQTFLWDDAFYPPREVSGFYTKSELQALIHKRDQRKDLRKFRVNRAISGRPYQLQALQAVAEHFAGSKGGKLVGRHRKALLVMATGSGKTRTAVSVVDMLTKCDWAKRILFLADRNVLVSQAKDAFKELLPELSAVDLTKEKEDLTARLVFSTYPTMLNQIDEVTASGVKKFGINHFDLIIIDEAHRSVYQKYQAIFDYFDGLLLGLTATPVKYVDRNTYELFEIEDDNPTFAYELDQAVADRYLVPPKTLDIPLKFPRSGVKYSELSDKDKKQFEELYGIASPSEEERDGLFIPGSKVNRFLFNNDTVDKILDLLFEKGLKVASGDKLGKTIIFAKNHRHAQFIAERFYKNYPEFGGDFLEVIDNYNDKAQDLITKFCFDKGEDKNPQIAVSVDMLDTGVDAPRVLNLVFFKEVKSYAKYWQMIGRGTRLCSNIFGPGEEKENDKQFFLIFDVCGNATYFEEEQERYDTAPQKSLSRVLFEAQLEVIHQVQLNPQATEEDRALAKDYTEELYHKIQSLDESHYAVRKHWEVVRKYKERNAWEIFSESKIAEMVENLGGLISWEEGQDELAKKFDLLIYRLQLAFLTTDRRQTRLIENIQKLGYKLQQKLMIPSVKQKEEVIRSITETTFWNQIRLARLEKLRTDLRDLIQFLQNDQENPVYSNFADVLNYGQIREVDIMEPRPRYENYRARVENFIRQNRHHLVIDKIYRNIPITPDELKKLEDFLQHEDFKVREIEEEFEVNSLTTFVRKVLGMDIEAANKYFAQFIQEEDLNNNQIQFMNLIIHFLNKNGVLDKSMLTQPPFNGMSDGGIIDLFPAGKIHKITKMLDELDVIHAEG